MQTFTRLGLFLVLILPSLATEPVQPVATVAELWKGYDPRALPIEAEVVKETVADGLVLRTIKYTSEINAGFKVRVIAYYGFPVGGKNLPAVLHLHGAGQNATLGYVKYWAQRGYATLSINWGGRALEDNPANGRTDFGPIKGDMGTFKANGRDNPWYHYTIAGRRALTFLEQQPEVDPARLGVFGVSMGGRLTWLVAGLESRLRCAASVYGATLIDEPIPGVEGSAYEPTLANQPLWRTTLDAHAYAPLIKCPFYFISAANDFFGRLDNADRTLREIPDQQRWITLSPHFSHHVARDEAESLVLWMGRWLQGGAPWPPTPLLGLDLKQRDHVVAAQVELRDSTPVERVDIYYSTGKFPQARFWRTAETVFQQGRWQAKLPLTALDGELIATAKVVYKSGLSLNTLLAKAGVEELGRARIAATDRPTEVIDDFSRGAVDWFVTEATANILLTDRPMFKELRTPDGANAIARDEANLPEWRLATRKVGDPKWQGPAGAGIKFEVMAERANVLTIVAIRNYESYPWPGQIYAATVPLVGGQWEHVAVKMEDFKEVTGNAGQPLASWDGINLLGFVGKWTFPGRHMNLPNYTLGTAWTGPAPAIAKLTWEPKQPARP